MVSDTPRGQIAKMSTGDGHSNKKGLSHKCLTLSFGIAPFLNTQVPPSFVFSPLRSRRSDKISSMISVCTFAHAFSRK